MNWTTFFTTFGLVFVAELGDKTQLAAMAITGKTKTPWEVFLGASLALVAATAIGVFVGAVLARYLNEKWINFGAGLLFIGAGAYILIHEIFFEK